MPSWGSAPDRPRRETEEDFARRASFSLRSPDVARPGVLFDGGSDARQVPVSMADGNPVDEFLDRQVEAVGVSRTIQALVAQVTNDLGQSGCVVAEQLQGRRLVGVGILLRVPGVEIGERI